MVDANGRAAIVWVDRDSIGYVNNMGLPRTLWLHRTAQGLRVKMMEGFLADPPDGWHDGIGLAPCGT
jgi:hypothetical protein